MPVTLWPLLQTCLGTAENCSTIFLSMWHQANYPITLLLASDRHLLDGQAMAGIFIGIESTYVRITALPHHPG